MRKRAPRMLVIAPHPDDETLGTGGTMAGFAEKGGEVTVLTVAAHMPPLYPEEIHEKTVSEAQKAHALLGVKRSIFWDNPAVFVNQIPKHKLNNKILEVVKEVEPDILLLPYSDIHVDHKCIFEAGMVVSRPVGVGRDIKILAAYETLSETHWNAPHLEPNFTPNWCVDITNYIDRKIEAMRQYESQLHPFPMPRSLEAIKALALFRGSQAGMGYGEGYHILRMTALPSKLF